MALALRRDLWRDPGRICGRLDELLRKEESEPALRNCSSRLYTQLLGRRSLSLWLNGHADDTPGAIPRR